MLTRTKLFLFLFVSQCPPSLLIPLAQQDVASTSNTNNLVVLGTNKIEEITPNNSIVTELLQQIDVKDDENHVISNVNHVVVSDENIQNDNNETQNNGTNNVIHGLQNNLPNVTKINALKTTNSATIKELRTVQNGSTSNVNVNSTSAPNTNMASRKSRISIGSENDASLNNNLSSRLKNEETGVPTIATIDGENILYESLIDGDAEIAWRSVIPVEKKMKTKAKLDSQNATLLANYINGSVNNNNNDLLNSENDDAESIFVILNSGNIDGLSLNSSANSGSLQTNLKNNTIENLNSNNSKLLSDLINSTINDVLSKILQQNISRSNSNHIFLLLNSGSISNVQVSFPVLANILKNATLKDRSRRHLNKNDTDVESVTLKPSTDKSNRINDIKFRISEHRGTENNVNKDSNVVTKPIDNNENNSNFGSNAPDNASLTNSNATVVDLINDKEISSAGAPAFRSLIPDKIRKLQQVANVVNNELNETKDNLVLKLSPESPPISIDLNQIPINNLLGGALSFIKRLKRNTHDKADNSYPWKTNCKTATYIDEHHTVKSCKKSQSFNNDLTISTKKSLDYNISKLLKLYESVEIVCPLSVIVKLYTRQVLDNLAKNDPESVLNRILTSFVKGNKDVINLSSKELPHLPISVKLRLQLVHGKTKEFMEQLSDIVDATLCSLS